MKTAGVDEVGRGPLAGPVVAAACVFKEGYSNSALTDSKKLSARKREELYQGILDDCLDWSVVAVPPPVIDQLNILQAALRAMSIAVNRVTADRVLVDGNKRIQTSLPQVTVVKGDLKHVEISAASIIAKVWRDRLMSYYDERYPEYGLRSHAGYPTKAHRAALIEHGVSAIHRRSFRPVSELL